MDLGDLISVSWQMPPDDDGMVVARTVDEAGEVREHRWEVEPDDRFGPMPDEVARIVREDGRDYGVWTRD